MSSLFLFNLVFYVYMYKKYIKNINIEKYVKQRKSAVHVAFLFFFRKLLKVLFIFNFLSYFYNLYIFF